MSLTDVILSLTDPATTLLMVLVVGYLRQIKRQLQEEIRRLRERTERLEGKHIARQANDGD